MKIRLWKVGFLNKENPLNSVLPTKQMLEKVRELISSSISGGVTDIIWGPDLNVELVEIDENIKNFTLNEDGKLVEL